MWYNLNMITGFIFFALIYGAIDCDVLPEEARVYVNGEYLGIADQFDGWPRFLYIQAGKYDISFKLEGYEDLNLKVEVIPNKIIRIKEKMKRIPPSQFKEEKVEEFKVKKISKGKISISIFPEEAVLYLDGKFWITAQEIARLHNPLQIDEGKHIIDVVCPGYENFKKEIDIKSGEYLELNIVLVKIESSLKNE